MPDFFNRRNLKFFRKIISSFIVLTFLTSLIVAPAGAQILPVISSPVSLNSAFMPPVLLGLKVHPENPLLFDFIVDQGQTKLSTEELKKETEKLVKYFLAALTIPDKEVWVNLSPTEKDRIIPDVLGQTTMGKTMLEQDYLLKQMAASLTNPETELGKKYWDQVTAAKQQEARRWTVDVGENKKQPTASDQRQVSSDFSKVWIMPAKAEVLESNGIVLVGEKRLKVMLAEDYEAKQSSLLTPSLVKEGQGGVLATNDRARNVRGSAEPTVARPRTTNNSTQIFRSTILPVIDKAVNEGKDFAEVRQIYNSVILAAWYKKALKESLLGKVYADQGKVAGVETDDKAMKQRIYQQYLAAFKKGAYNLIKEEADENGDLIPRKYFSGGEFFVLQGESELQRTPASLRKVQSQIAVNSSSAAVTVQLGTTGNEAQRLNDLAVLPNDTASSSAATTGQDNQALTAGGDLNQLTFSINFLQEPSFQLTELEKVYLRYFAGEMAVMLAQGHYLNHSQGEINFSGKHFIETLTEKNYELDRTNELFEQVVNKVFTVLQKDQELAKKYQKEIAEVFASYFWQVYHLPKLENATLDSAVDLGSQLPIRGVQHFDKKIAILGAGLQGFVAMTEYPEQEFLLVDQNPFIVSALRKYKELTANQSSVLDEDFTVQNLIGNNNLQPIFDRVILSRVLHEAGRTHVAANSTEGNREREVKIDSVESQLARKRLIKNAVALLKPGGTVVVREVLDKSEIPYAQKIANEIKDMYNHSSYTVKLNVAETAIAKGDASNLVAGIVGTIQRASSSTIDLPSATDHAKNSLSAVKKQIKSASSTVLESYFKPGTDDITVGAVRELTKIIFADPSFIDVNDIDFFQASFRRTNGDVSSRMKSFLNDKSEKFSAIAGAYLIVASSYPKILVADKAEEVINSLWYYMLRFQSFGGALPFFPADSTNPIVKRHNLAVRAISSLLIFSEVNVENLNQTIAPILLDSQLQDVNDFWIELATKENQAIASSIKEGISSHFNQQFDDMDELTAIVKDVAKVLFINESMNALENGTLSEAKSASSQIISDKNLLDIALANSDASTYLEYIENKKTKALARWRFPEVIDAHRFLSLEESKKIFDYFAQRSKNSNLGVVMDLIDKLNTPGERIALDIGPGSSFYFGNAMAKNGGFTAVGVGIEEVARELGENILLLDGDINDVLQSFPDRVFNVISFLNPDKDGRNPRTGPDQISIALIKNGIVASKVKVGGRVIIKPFWPSTYAGVQDLTQSGFKQMTEVDFRKLFKLGDSTIEGNNIGTSQRYDFFVWQKLEADKVSTLSAASTVASAAVASNWVAQAQAKREDLIGKLLSTQNELIAALQDNLLRSGDQVNVTYRHFASNGSISTREQVGFISKIVPSTFPTKIGQFEYQKNIDKTTLLYVDDRGIALENIASLTLEKLAASSGITSPQDVMQIIGKLRFLRTQATYMEVFFRRNEDYFANYLNQLENRLSAHPYVLSNLAAEFKRFVEETVVQVQGLERAQQKAEIDRLLQSEYGKYVDIYAFFVGRTAQENSPVHQFQMDSVDKVLASLSDDEFEEFHKRSNSSLTRNDLRVLAANRGGLFMGRLWDQLFEFALEKAEQRNQVSLSQTSFDTIDFENIDEAIDSTTDALFEKMIGDNPSMKKDGEFVKTILRGIIHQYAMRIYSENKSVADVLESGIKKTDREKIKPSSRVSDEKMYDTFKKLGFSPTGKPNQQIRPLVQEALRPFAASSGVKDKTLGASTLTTEDQQWNKGGIDFDPTNMDLQIKRDGKGVPLPLPQQNLEQINIQGLFPVIINIVPMNAQTLPIFLGFARPNSDDGQSSDALGGPLPKNPAREPELAVLTSG